MKTISPVKLAFFVVASLLVNAAGCGPGSDGRLAVSGWVKLKGEPVKDGVIEFVPLDTQQQSSQSGAMITNGSYVVPADSGLFPGKYKVIITAGDGRTPVDANPDEPPGPTGANIVSKELIPAEYNVNSKQEVEVKEGQNVFNYDIP